VEAMADRWGDLVYALGGRSGRRDGRAGHFVDGPREKWKPNLQVIKATIQYVMKTARFQPKATLAGEAGVEVTRAVEETGTAEEGGLA
jgi:hypothetical protein